MSCWNYTGDCGIVEGFIIPNPIVLTIVLALIVVLILKLFVEDKSGEND